MKIIFDKINSNGKPFELEIENVSLIGTLQKSGYHRVSLNAKINGNVKLNCDRCGEVYNYKFDNNLKLTISDQLIEDKDDLDIIEFLDGVIDIAYILESEINTLKSSYHYCDNCCSDDEEFEVEY